MLSRTSRWVSSAAPTWLATAVRSRVSPAVNRTPERCPTRVMTPTVRAGPSGGVKFMGADR